MEVAAIVSDELNGFAEDLHDEVVSEIAQSYFGTRKNLDNMIEAIETWAAELREWKPKLNRAAVRLHSLLLDSATAKDFYIALDVLPSCIPFEKQSGAEPLLPNVPFSFTKRGRYIKCVLQAYDSFQKIVDEYLNGRYYSDPQQEDGRKLLTIHYIRFKAMMEYVNSEIDKVNREMTTGDTLRYIRRLNPEAMEKQKVLDSCIGDSCSLDGKSDFQPMSLSEFDLPEMQDLPVVGKVRNEIKMFCKQLYQERKEDISDLLAEARRSS